MPGLRNTDSDWGAVSRAIHWIMAALIVVQLPLGFRMIQVYAAYLRNPAQGTSLFTLSRIHHTVGFLILTGICLRIAWRLSNPTPRLPPSTGPVERVMARVNQGLLCLLLVIYPLSGWAALSAYSGQFPIYFFGWQMPRLVAQRPKNVTFSYEWFARIHQTCWKIAAVLIALHVAGAAWHAVIARDQVVQRMWRGRRTLPASELSDTA